MRRFLVLAVVLAACESAAPSASAPPAVASTPASPRAVPPAATPADERFGVLLRGVDGLNLRSEESPDPLVSLKGVQYAVASPDGRKVAYWQIGADLVPELVVYDTLAGTLRRTYALDGPPEFAAGIRVTWSPSSDRVAFVVRSMSGAPGNADPPAYVALRIVDLASGDARELLRREASGFGIRSWPLPDRIVIGSDPTGPGRSTSFSVVREDGAIVDASNDERTFATTYDGAGRYAMTWDCTVDRGCAPRIERRADPSDVVFPAAPPGERLERLLFRPGSSDLVAVLRPASGPFRVERWEDGGRGARVVLTTLTLDRPVIDELYVRPDGSGAAFLLFDSTKTGRWYGDLVDLRTGARSPFEVPYAGNPLAWIRLRAGGPRVIDPSPPALAPLVGEERARWIATRGAMGRVAGTDVRLVSFADAMSWSRLATQRGAGSGLARQNVGLVYVVVVRAPMRFSPRRGNASLCTWFYDVIDARDGAELLEVCPATAGPSELPEAAPSPTAR